MKGFNVWCMFGILISTFFTHGLQNEFSEGENEEFIPTKEWQQVKPGQTIPPGLHVRMDLTKGGKWAKLMDEETSQSQTKSVMVGKDPQQEETASFHNIKRQDYKIQELKSALKKIKLEKITETEEHEKEIKEKFRSMDEIKSDLEELNLNQESDFEAMSRLLLKYKYPAATAQDKLSALQDLEYYVHQVDNANDFVKIDGLSTVLQGLNSSDSKIRQEAAHVIGSAVQSNPAVQVKAVELGSISTLLRLLADTNQSLETRKKAMYAVSSLIRHFPTAQHFFNNAGGFSTLMNLFKEHGAEKLQLKAIALINDLAVERKDLNHLDRNEKQYEEKSRQYNLFSLSSAIEEMALCQDITTMLNTDLHDQRETLLIAMRNLHGVCKEKNQYVVKVASALNDFQGEYKNLLKIEEEEGDNDSFYHHMYNIVTELISLLKRDNLWNIHTEL